MSRRIDPMARLQKSSDFFRSATRNINIVVWVIRILAALFLYLLISTVYGILIPEVKDINNLLVLFQILVLFFFVIILALLTLVSYAVSPLTTATQAAHYFWTVRAFIIHNIFGSVSTIDGLSLDDMLGGSSDPLAPLAYLLNKPQRVVYNTQVLYGFILLCLIFMFITGIGFIRRSSVQLAGITLGISQLVIALAYMKGLILPMTLNVGSIQSMLSSNLFQLALLSYLYFEFSLQTGYIYSLTKPTLSRQKRVGKQLSRLSEFRLGITKLGTEDEKAAKKVAKDIKDEQVIDDDRETTALSAGSGSTTARKFGADALVFLLDSAQDSMFAKPGGEQERLTGRLQRYHDGLLAHDRALDDKLGGSAAKAFNPFMVLLIVITSMIFRVILLIGFTWMVLNSSKVLGFINLPPAVTNSLELYEPEGMLVILIPLIFFMLGVSYIISKIQNYLVKSEELIIQESDIQKILKEGKAITSREEAEKSIAEKQAQEIKKSGADTQEKPRPRRKKRKRPDN